MPGATALRLLFLVTLLGCVGYALARGGRDERQVAAAVLLAALASYPAALLLGSGWREPELGVLAVDLALLAALVAVALRSDRYWPLWIAAFQLVAVVTHLAIMLDPQVVPRAYALAQPFWAYPVLLTLTFATRSRSRRSRSAAATR